jgi:hypothetical protein
MSLELIQSRHAFYIFSREFVCKEMKVLEIQRNTPIGEIKIEEKSEETVKKESNNDLRESLGQIYGIFGVMVINGEEFLCVISEIVGVGSI